MLILPATDVAPAAWGTTLRCYDPRLDRWNVTWFAADEGRTAWLHARADPDGAVLEEVGGRMRWSFRDVAADRFTWRGEIRGRSGWTLAEVMRAERR